MVHNTAMATDIAADDDDNEDNANKCFEKIRLTVSTMHEWAESVWTAEDATPKASDGESENCARRAFSEFIFAAVTSELQKSIQNSISVVVAVLITMYVVLVQLWSFSRTQRNRNRPCRKESILSSMAFVIGLTS
jgi:hypothetical protein